MLPLSLLLGAAQALPRAKLSAECAGDAEALIAELGRRARERSSCSSVAFEPSHDEAMDAADATRLGRALISVAAPGQLSFSDAHVGDAGAVAIAPEISVLVAGGCFDVALDECSIGDAGAAALADHLLSDASMDKPPAGLLEIDLSGNRIHDAGARKLAGILGSSGVPVTRLDLSRNAIGADGVTTLLAMVGDSALTELVLVGNETYGVRLDEIID